MGQYLLQRLLQTIPTLIGISIITFVVLRLTGDPAVMILGEMATAEALAEYRAQHGLDAPLHIQYIRYMANAFQGDFGDSLRYREPVGKLLLERLPATLLLGMSALIFSLVVGIPVGVFSALRRSGMLDLLVRSITLLGQAVPGFYLGILLILLFSVRLGWFPTGGRGGLRHLVLPTIALGANLVALIVRFTRSTMLDVLRNDYIRTARAKGLHSTTVIGRHGMKNAMIPVVTIAGGILPALIGGAVIMENIFALPGLGQLGLQALTGRNYPMVSALNLIMATVVMVNILLIDMSYAWLDPRVRYK